MSACEDALLRAVGEFRAMLNPLGSNGVAQASELLHLDALVRKYPAAARRSLAMIECAAKRPAHRR